MIRSRALEVVAQAMHSEKLPGKRSRVLGVLSRLEAASPRRSFCPLSFPKPAIERDPVPQTNSQPWEPPLVDRNPSFRRRSAYRSEQDWKRRTGRWSLQQDSMGGQSDAQDRRYPSRGNSGQESENYHDQSRASYERSQLEPRRSGRPTAPRRMFSEEDEAERPSEFYDPP